MTKALQRSKAIPRKVIFDPILPDGRRIAYTALRGWYIKP